ncbi:hypothetical protein [Fontivita pretiosa]|uniref:hypothetical protein n=1 Tax=Fontivita pretiosa TaxID=2989684 RepID=UPI003D17F262
MNNSIICVGTHRTVHFAATELARHLQLATGRPWSVVKGSDTSAAPFRVGVCEDLNIARPRDLKGDQDWVLVRQFDSSPGYVLSGSNPRSVLMAVYRYLRELGFRWIRPGDRGLIVPKLRDPIARRLHIDQRPAYKFRTVCIEGACSIQHVLDMIDWLPKAGMNGYFLQFRYGTTFFKRWYEHQCPGRNGSPYLKPEPFDESILRQYVSRLEAAIADRGLNFERVGHGWTSAALGLPGEGWDRSDYNAIPPERREWIAQVNGKKELWGGIALNTNLNYSNPAARNAMTDAIVEYAAQHPEVNLLHFWLSDATNNHDESPESRAVRPSDFYVDMLNELDDKLAARNLPTRIVCLIYFDLLWPPIRSRVKNQDRFVLMLAPITRSYLRSFGDRDPSGEKPAPFVYNKLKYPRSLEVFEHFLRQWRKHLRGDAFDFDYHALWAPYLDPFHFTVARTLHRDIQRLKDIGLHGYNSCQVQRLSFPHHLIMDVMSQALWDPRISFERIVRQTFADAFGAAGQRVARIFDQSSKLWKPMFEPVYVPETDGPRSRTALIPDKRRIAQARRNIPRISNLNQSLKTLVLKELPQAKGAVKWSWRYLKHHTRLIELLLPAMLAYLDADPTLPRRMDRVYDYLWRTEKLLHPALDAFLMTQVLQSRVREVENIRAAKAR